MLLLEIGHNICESNLAALDQDMKHITQRIRRLLWPLPGRCGVCGGEDTMWHWKKTVCVNGHRM